MFCITLGYCVIFQTCPRLTCNMASMLVCTILNEAYVLFCTAAVVLVTFRCKTFRLLIPIILIPIAAAIPHCSETFISTLIVNPKSYSRTVELNKIPPSVNCTSSFPCRSCVEACTFTKIEQHLLLSRPFDRPIKTVLQTFCISVWFNPFKHF